MENKTNISDIDTSIIGVEYKTIAGAKVKWFDLEKRVNYIDWKQFLPVYGFYKASKDVLSDRPSVLREFAGLSPLKYFSWMAYQAASTFTAMGLIHDYLIK